MVRYLTWLANGALFILCCFLVASTANAVFAAILAPSPGDQVSAAPRPSLPKRSWQDRQVILSRNLFNASLLAPPPAPDPEPVEVEEDLEATKLPLTLVGTAACTPGSPEPGCSFAVIEDKQKREAEVVRVNDPIQTAKVVRIERRRVVLSEGGTLRELALDEDENGSTARPKRTNRSARARPARRAPDRRRAERVRKIAEDRFSVPKEEVDEMVRNPAALFSQARILPKYDEGEMIGLQVNAIKAGSLLEEIGLNNGDVITELNGIAIDSPEESAKILAEFQESSEFNVVVETSDGQVQTLNFTMPGGE